MATKKTLVTEPKKPFDLDKHIGIEIELLSPFNRDQAIKILEKDDFRKFVQIKSDSSVYADTDGEYQCKSCQHWCNDHEARENKMHCHICNEVIAIKKDINTKAKEPHELCFLFKQKDLLFAMKKINGILIKLEAHVNTSCGLHVHLDMRQRKAEECFTRLVKAQPTLFNMVHKDRRSSTYCTKTPDNVTLTSGGGRYAINPNAFSKHQTIEVRLHHGTTKTKEIFWWIKTLLNIVEDKKPGVLLSRHIKNQTEAMKKAS